MASEANEVPVVVPADSASLLNIWRFALSYRGYERHGGIDGTAEIAQEVRRRWSVDAALPDDLATARAALFFEQRSYRFSGDEPEPGDEDDVYIRALVRVIHQLSGGTVLGVPEPFR